MDGTDLDVVGKSELETVTEWDKAYHFDLTTPIPVQAGDLIGWYDASNTIPGGMISFNWGVAIPYGDGTVKYPEPRLFQISSIWEKPEHTRSMLREARSPSPRRAHCCWAVWVSVSPAGCVDAKCCDSTDRAVASK
jgi:hypothetical protein